MLALLDRKVKPTQAQIIVIQKAVTHFFHSLSNMNAVLFIFYVLCVSIEFEKSNCDDDALFLWLEGGLKSREEKDIFDSYHHMTELEDIPDVCDDYDSESCASRWLEQCDIIRKRNKNRLQNIKFQYYSNMNRKSLKLKIKFQLQMDNIHRQMNTKLQKFQFQRFNSSRIKRIFGLLVPTILGKNVSMSEMKSKISQNIKHIYNNARPCYGYCLNKGELGIVDVFENERDYEKLLGFWRAWADVTGAKIRDLFIERMHLENIGARENGYSDAASFKLQDAFEEDNLDETVHNLFGEILPLYEQLHGFVRHCLAEYYPDKFDKTGPIPAHILGDVWAQQWHNILPIIQKCRNKTSSNNIFDDVNKQLSSVSIQNMFKMAETFYASLGLFKMTSDFWNRSVLFQSVGKLVDCHGSAFDFANTRDFRIMMCTKRNFNDFSTIHHEMGHIEYYMANRYLPFDFQNAANPGFHEAVGDTIGLSVKTPEHLHKIGLIPEIPTSEEFDIDYLLASALERVAFLPFALTMDSYIWGVYNGSVARDQLNEHWWRLRHRFQGLKPPIERTENDFDPAAKFHISFGISYTRYFVSHILEFQFYEAMCKLSGHSGPLHRCDFYQSKVAGEKLLKMLEQGKIQNWRDTLKILTGSRDLTSKSLMRFYEPLYKWLIETNENLKIPIGW